MSQLGQHRKRECLRYLKDETLTIQTSQQSALEASATPRNGRVYEVRWPRILAEVSLFFQASQEFGVDGHGGIEIGTVCTRAEDQVPGDKQRCHQYAKPRHTCGTVVGIVQKTREDLAPYCGVHIVSTPIS